MSFVEELCDDASDFTEEDLEAVARIGTRSVASTLAPVRDGSLGMVTSPLISVFGLNLPGGIVETRIGVPSQRGGVVGRNRTVQGLHVFHEGLVDREFFINDAGGLSVESRGAGTHHLFPAIPLPGPLLHGAIVNRAIAVTNQVANPLIFRELNARLRVQLNGEGGLCNDGPR